MPKWNQRIETSRPIWIASTLAAYGVFGVVLEVPFGKSSVRLREIALVTIRNFDKAEVWMVAVVVLFGCIVLAIPCIGLGWIAQGTVLLVFPGLRRDRSPDLQADYMDVRPIDGTPWQSHLK